MFLPEQALELLVAAEKGVTRAGAVPFQGEEDLPVAVSEAPFCVGAGALVEGDLLEERVEVDLLLGQ